MQKKVNKGKENEDREGFVQVVKKQWKKKPIQPNVNVEGARNGQAGGASTSHSADKENFTKPLDPKPFDDGPKVAKVIEKGKEKAEGNLAGAKSNGTGFGCLKADGKTKTMDGQGEGVKHTPGPIPFYQSVLKSFQPRRGAPLTAANRFASLACNLNTDDDEVSEDNLEEGETVVKEGEDESAPLEDVDPLNCSHD